MSVLESHGVPPRLSPGRNLLRSAAQQLDQRAVRGLELLAVDPLGRFVGLGLLGTIGGLAVGAAQWFAVRRHAPLRVTWVLWCAASFGVAFPTGGLAAVLVNPGVAVSTAAVFKALGRALRNAVSTNPRIADTPSTKGSL